MSAKTRLGGGLALRESSKGDRRVNRHLQGRMRGATVDQCPRPFCAVFESICSGVSQTLSDPGSAFAIGLNHMELPFL